MRRSKVEFAMETLQSLRVLLSFSLFLVALIDEQFAAFLLF
jgi:uncharacterized membrane protein